MNNLDIIVLLAAWGAMMLALGEVGAWYRRRLYAARRLGRREAQAWTRPS
jgi:hypothetical protein